MFMVAISGVLLLSCGKGGNASESISDDGLFGSTGAEFVDIYLTDPDSVRLVGRISNEVMLEMEKIYSDFNLYGNINPKYVDEFEKNLNERMSKFDMPAIREKWEKRLPELVAELPNIEVPAKVAEGTPLKLISPVKIKDLDKTMNHNYMSFVYSVELTEDVTPPLFSGACLCFMDADGHEIASGNAKGLKDAIQEGVKKGRQFELETMITLDKKTIANYFSAKYVMLEWNTFYVDDGKLGPVRVGMSYTDLPKSAPGLYDKFDYKKETIENEMDGDYEVESCTFIKGGKEYFKAELEDGKVTSIVLDQNSTGLYTKDDYCVGNEVITKLYGYFGKTDSGSFRNVVINESLKWENYYEGEVFVTIGRYTFYVPSDQANVEEPRTKDDFKSNARFSRIVCR